MPRPAKGARLYLRQGKRTAPVYVIRDGHREISTGCGADRLAEAEGALQAHLASRRQAPGGVGDPASVAIADVLTVYGEERTPTLSDPVSVEGWIERLLEFWGTSTCADIRRSSCNAYVKHRTSQPRRAAKTDVAKEVLVSAQTARRELETLSSAIGWWDRERPFTRRPLVTLPDKTESQRDALTRSQAAALLKAAMGWRKTKSGWVRLPRSARANRAHLRRFLLIGLYTGSRPGVIGKLLWRESPTQAWVDLDAGVIYRRGREERDHRTKRRPLCKLPPRLLAHMRRWHAADELAMQKSQVQLSVVIHHGGRPLAGKIRTGFEGIVRDAGLSAGITPHWMRHTAATWLMENDVETWAAAGYLGMTAATLEKTYGHHRPTHQSAARGAHSRRR